MHGFETSKAGRLSIVNNHICAGGCARRSSPTKGTEKQQNFTLLLGVLLEGDHNATRDDAGNLQVAKGSHLVLAERFRSITKVGGSVRVCWLAGWLAGWLGC